VSSILPHLIDHGGEIPEIRVEDMAARIETNFGDRAAWNQEIQESGLDPEAKLWLTVP